MNKGIIIQARYSATRLYGKLLRPFFNKQTILDILINKCIVYGQKNDIQVVLATTTNSADDEIVKYCEKYSDLLVYRGSEQNVLLRFIDAATCFGITEIIRVCADNPFLNINFASDYFYLATQANYDYISYFISPNKPVIKSHFGFWPEYVKLSALKKIFEFEHKHKHKEHVTIFLYENEQHFNIGKIKVSDLIVNNQNIRLTVDTYADFEIARKIYFELLSYNPNFTIDDIVNYVSKNKNITAEMKSNINFNTK